MKDLKKFGWMSVASIALFVLAGCSQAAAGGRATEKAQPAAIEVAAADAQPSSDAQADNGPGCAESMLEQSAEK